MIKVMKKQGKRVEAYQLGQAHPVLEALMAKKQIIDLHDGTYEVFSQEAVKAGSGHGQLAAAGDWIRIDGAGCPYPCRDDWFRANLRHIGADEYEQIPALLDAWTADQGIGPEIRFLMQQKGLVLDAQHPDRYFNAVLWGTREAAAMDAVLVFYSITRDAAGNIMDAEFNFVERGEFDRTYNVLA